MKRFLTACTGVAAVAALLLTPVGDLLAQKRVVLVEEFTSQTCPPCVPADPVLAEVVRLSNGIVSIRYHLSFPAPGDTYNVANPTENAARQSYYGANSIPTSRINGIYTVDPRDKDGLYNVAALSQAYSYPVEIAITEDRSQLPKVHVKVDVKSGMDLTNYVLQTVVVAEHVEMPNLPNELKNSNGQKEFDDAMLKMLPNANGTAVTMKRGETKSFNLSYDMNTESKNWSTEKGEILVIAFLQNTQTREIIQAATTESGEIGSRVSTSIVRTAPDLPGFSIKASGEKAEASFAIANNSSAAITYSVGKTMRTPENWSADIEGGEATVTVPAGEQKDVTVSFTKGDMTGIGDMVVTFKEAGGTDRVYPIHTVLSNDVKTLQLMDDGGSTAHSVANVLTAAGRKDYYEVPGALVKPALMDLPELKYMIWNCGGTGFITGDDQFLAMDLLEKGVGILFTGEAMMYGTSGSDPAASLHGSLGFSYVKPITLGRADGNIRLTGVANDPISAGFDQPGRLINYITPYIRSIDKKAVAMINHKGFADSTVAIRSELDNARAVTFAFSTSVITNTAARQDLVDKALKWIEGFVVVAKPSAVANIDLDGEYDFGSVKIGESKELVIEIKAANEAGLQITEILDWSENFAEYGLSIVGLPASFPATPITLKKDEMFSFKIKYAPTAEATFDDGRLSIVTNDNNKQDNILDIKGKAVNTTSVGEATSASGALFLTAGPNPFANTSVVTYAVQGAAAKDVRMTVYNELGQAVTTLLNATVQPGTYTVDLNGVNMPVGTYHIVMTAGGEKVTLPVVHVK